MPPQPSQPWVAVTKLTDTGSKEPQGRELGMAIHVAPPSVVAYRPLPLPPAVPLELADGRGPTPNPIVGTPKLIDVR